MDELIRKAGIFSFVTGAIVLLASYSSITGSVIFGSAAEKFTRFLGIILIILGGLIIFATKKGKRKRERKLEEMLANEETIKGKIKLIERAYHQEILNEDEATHMINNVAPLKGMLYKTQTKFTIESEQGQRYSLSQSRTDPELAYTMRDRIIENDASYKKNCELHISKKESTKHHRKGLRR